MQSTKTPSALAALICIAETFVILIEPSLFPVICILSAISAIIFFALFFKKKRFGAAVLFSFIILFCCANPYRIYITQEKTALSFTEQYKEYDNTVFDAVVYECQNYSSFSLIDVKITAAGGASLSSPIKARIGSYTAESFIKGDRLSFKGKPVPLDELEQEDFDTETYLRSKRTFVSFPYVTILSSHAVGKPDLFTSLRAYTKNTLYKYLSRNYDYDSSAVSYAMIAGDKEYIPSSVKEDFRFSGLTHILCVSGMHLTTIMGTIYILMSLMTVNKRVKCIIIILLCFFYSAFCGFSPSTIRAAIICSITFSGMLFSKNGNGYLSLFCAALLLCTVSPYSVLDISAQLSFLASLGILVVMDVFPHIHGKSFFSKAFGTVLDMIYANIGAVAFTLAISSYAFKSFSTVSVFSTLPASFPSELLLMGLLILLMLSPLSAFSFGRAVLYAIGGACNIFCTLLLSIAKGFSDFTYSAVTAENSTAFLILFIVSICAICVFICFGMKRCKAVCVYLTFIISASLCFFGLFNAIAGSYGYKVSYFRQNENDRQLSIKLSSSGYLIVNADSTLCTDSSKSEFDTRKGSNYLLIIPDEQVEVSILAQSIKSFDKRFGIKGVYLPETSDGRSLMHSMADHGIECEYMPHFADFGTFTLEYSSSDCEYISLSDKKCRTSIAFAESYNKNYFKQESDICAFFTRKTKNQFNPDSDSIPDCRLFYTRLGKNDSIDGIINTYSQKTFTIKG